MGGKLLVQTKRYGAITAFELEFEGHPVATLIKEQQALIDYSRKRAFEELDTAIDFYRMQLAPETDCWDVTLGCAAVTFVVHHSCWSFPLPGYVGEQVGPD